MANEFEQKADHGKTLLEWEFPEYEEQNRSAAWYIFAVPIAIALLVWALWTKNYLFAVIIIVSTVLLLRQQRTKPERLRFSLTEDGVDVHGRHFYSFRDLQNYWLAYEPPEVKRLYFSFKAGFRPRLAISLEDVNPLTVREVLSQYLPEDLEREGEPTTEALARILKL